MQSILRVHFLSSAHLPPILRTSAGRHCRRAVMSTMLKNESQSIVSPSSAIDFLALVHNLKATKRTGWVRMGVDGPESIADHMYRMSLMALIGAGAGIDQQRCIKLAIVHDVAEAIVGDITPVCGVSNEEKYRLENEAMQRIRTMLGPDTAAGKEVEELWHEYESASSPEAQLVKDFDKLEMIMQAHEYEESQGKQLDEFFTSTDGKWRTELGKLWAAEIVSRRNRSLAERAAK